MRQKRKLKAMALLIFVFAIVISTFAVVQAGSVNDFGQLSGTPAQANYVAWLGTTNPPTQILTEDGRNPENGVDQGYQSNFWIIEAGNFNNPAASNGTQLSFVFGGLGANAGTIWTHSATYDGINPNTDHGIISSSSSASCPTMLSSSSGPTINWSAAAGTYHIYRSQNASNAGNGASNGLYDYLDTVTTAGASGSYTDSSPGSDNWYLVVPADSGTNAINGCHSEEAGPLAANLATFTAISQPDHVLVDWATVFEQSNLGFNLLRSTSADGAQVAINPELIPSQAPGSGQGASYSFEDSDVEDGTTYYYWLQDVDTGGTTGQHGPVSVTYESNATAVDVSTLGAESRWGEPWTNGLLGTLLLAGAVGYVWHRRRRASS